MSTRNGLRSLLFAVVVFSAVAWFVLNLGGLRHEIESPAPIPSLTATSSVSAVDTELFASVEESGDWIRIAREGLPTPGCDTVADQQPVMSEVEFNGVFADAVSILSVSKEAEHLLAAAMLIPKDDDEQRVAYLEQSMAMGEPTPLLFWQMLRHCDIPSCDRSAVFEKALAVAPSNAAFWMEAAKPEIMNGNWADAERLLRRGISAGEFNLYFIDQAMMIERALAASTNFDYTERVFAGLGIGAAVAIPTFGDLTRACRTDSNDPSVWIPLCDDFGRMMIDTSDTLIGKMIGYALRRVATERGGDSELAAEIKREEQKVREELIEGSALSGMNALLENDPKFLGRYVDHFAAHGEESVIKYGTREAQRLRQEPTYDQCNFVVKKPVS